ncbi:MAG: sigma-54-dependent Fis family transcriptional regulator [Bacteroidetes bacterium]|nr:sigma-54-dependent Fis family transcriptional regulator [Bacteroidota bacterium]
MAKILIVDDDNVTLSILKQVLYKANHDVTTAIDGEEAIQYVKNDVYDIIVTDFNMPGMNGIELTKEILKINPQSVIILITAYISVKAALESIKLGAFDYLTKPVDKEELLLSIERGLERLKLLEENSQLKKAKTSPERVEFKFETKSDEVKKILAEAAEVAQSDSTVLITGSNGTGKEVLAEFIHKNSKRNKNTFVVVNCAAIPEQLLESELFGHSKGSFTGAIKDHKGYFEIANNGSIFLDEIGDLDTPLQVKLLRVLQTKQFARVGDPKPISTNVRIIAATNRNLKELIKDGKFREDLYYRINVFEYHLPDLKDRPSDIIFYFEKFIKEYSKENGKKIKEISKEVKDLLFQYPWPGNIRELKNIAERASVLCKNGIISGDLLPDRIKIDGEIAAKEPELNEEINTDYEASKNELLKEFERDFIKKHLKKRVK